MNQTATVTRHTTPRLHYQVILKRDDRIMLDRSFNSSQTANRIAWMWRNGEPMADILAWLDENGGVRK